ncbi:cell division protein ZapE [Kaistia dalseonensis]|uniref:Cell division protein ZapE n=1 Tax=Kaistia dalseonensis TaxID=410840 RepID=A0ABU0H3P2_9HYPH|nr:cell division protein ZapE [Kaistia dalseonensis]MCX5494324.1 cell division protein ZapE [Kaistia dalseonensis]MDQ0436905.1 cell division protein ZapE [Kaistia dalseonensis]
MSEGLPVASRVTDGYDELVRKGAIEDDPAQRALVAKLDGLNQRVAAGRLANKSSALGWLFGRRASAADHVRGLYIYGDVGRGKTMLMDLFFERAATEKKRRAHFNDFMADVHARVFKAREAIKSGALKNPDPIPPVAADIAADAQLLCFDEFTVTDIADAMILGRLFTQLFAKGVVMVATSNVAPDDLYRDGINRSHFLPFIHLLKEREEIIHLGARTDFRQEKTDRAAIYLTPLGPEADAALDAAWLRLTGTRRGPSSTLTVLGREVTVPQSARGVARFTFDDLCAKPLGASDYLAIAHSFDTVILDHVPVMGEANRNEAKRFITLIDALYDGHVKLIVSAAAEPEGLYGAESGTEAFEFARTASRLVEMRSHDYLKLPHRGFIAET